MQNNFYIMYFLIFLVLLLMIILHIQNTKKNSDIIETMKKINHILVSKINDNSLKIEDLEKNIKINLDEIKNDIINTEKEISSLSINNFDKVANQCNIINKSMEEFFKNLNNDVSNIKEQGNLFNQTTTVKLKEIKKELEDLSKISTIE